MDIDLSLISSVLKTDGGYYQAKKSGISSAMIEGDAASTGWKYIDDHVLAFGKTPSVGLFQQETGVFVIDVEDELDVLISNIKSRSLFNRLRVFHDRLGGHLTRNEVREAQEYLQDTNRQLYSDGFGTSKIESLLALGDDVVDYYNRIKNGERGILTPWETLNDVSMGWWGGDFISVIARTGIGKTYFLLMLARQAWMNGKSVLFVGTEMSRLKLAIRYYCIHLGIPVEEFRHGKLDTDSENQLKSKINEIKGFDGLYVVGDDFDATMPEIMAATDEVKPDLLLVDGMYLVKNEGRTKHERVSNTADDLKRLARRRNIPAIASTQFNRNVSKNSSATVDESNIGLSDAIANNSDLSIGLYQTDDMFEDHILGVRFLKVRDAVGRDFFNNWNFDTMNFAERKEESRSYNNCGSTGGEDDSGAFF